MSSPAKIPLCQLPTPLHRLDRVSKDLGIDLWIKRDDLTGFALGGNKGRKLEYLMQAVVDSGADTVVSCGATQSNFIRQLGAACAVSGVRCVVACMNSPYETPDRIVHGASEGGNPDLDSWFGIERHLLPDGTWEEMDEQARALADRESTAGHTVYYIPVGGSVPLGALGFYDAGVEFKNQADQDFNFIITASSSGSTQVGLASAFAGTNTQVIGIACDPDPEVVTDLVTLSTEFAEQFGLAPSLGYSQFDFRLDYVGPGYGVPGEATLEAMRYLARTEGIVLDPVYSGKAFSGLIDLARTNQISGRVAFWHTGGTPAIFAKSPTN
ncbi:D-cysteine desulfhydrase family protein [Geitlerinema splendidum]|nr:D-cysteine desulfhydrase family protein [Geitlerinema splendidum]